MAKEKLINLVAADMGYGHQRAAYPLLGLSGGEMITVNDYKGIPEWEKDIWLGNLKSYENISRFKKVPVIGKGVFATMNYLQRIKPFYPFRDLSKPTLQQKYFYKLIKKGLGKDLMEKLGDSRLPLVTTFFVGMYMAEEHNYRGDIYAVVCDADISRAWAPLNAKRSRVKFFVPNSQVKARLIMYGVKEDNIIITGFPLPTENIGEKKEILKKDLAVRIANLDVDYVYREKEKALLKKIIPDTLENRKKKAISITFAVGGAGAQKEIGGEIVKELAPFIVKNEFVVNLVAGIRPEVKDYFEMVVKDNNLKLGKDVNIIFHKDKIEYFKLFNKTLRQTDILWTKPSELSFYSGLGLPIIMSETVGSQEDFNRAWLIAIGAGIDSKDVRHVDEWLFDMLKSGRLARAAMDGFLNAENQGTYNIEKEIKK
ncbi:MAG: hypothetical protein PWQ35_169 [Patescibacteria group bacterium]|nr:hypothetical protein [Patescibacteria group bacterium]